MDSLILATQNEHKVQELRALLGNRLSLLSLADVAWTEDIPETGSSITENSYLKAAQVAKTLQRPCLSDDSGLEVFALSGAPGVHSARYAGWPKDDAKNLALLLKNMEGVQDRRARFITVLTYFDGAHFHVFEGEVQGQLLSAGRGQEGFGYDPIFVPENQERSFAEMRMEEKNLWAHRARAIRKFIDYLDNLQ